MCVRAVRYVCALSVYVVCVFYAFYVCVVMFGCLYLCKLCYVRMIRMCVVSACYVMYVYDVGIRV